MPTNGREIVTKRKQYTADEFRKLKERLINHRVHTKLTLYDLLTSLGDGYDFEVCCEIRDRSQHLVSTTLAISNIDMSIALANDTGKPRHAPFDLAQCGLEDL